MVEIRIDIISDVVCVWCFIGKKRLEKAIELYQKTYPGGRSDTFIITWRPYYLNPHLFPESIDKTEMAKTKLKHISMEKRAAIQSQLIRIGQTLGLNFSWGGKIGPTRDAHRLIHFSQTKDQDTQSIVAENIFKAYHEEERDISSREVLLEIAVASGLDEGDIKNYLNDEQTGQEVDEEEKQWKERTSSGVPMFIIQDVHKVDGAQDPMEFFEVFEKIKSSE